MTTEVVRCPACGRKNRVGPTAKGKPACAQCHAPLPWVVAADDSTFQDAVATSLPVLVDLWAPWCGPCRMVAPVVQAAAEERAGALKVVKVDVDQSPATARRFGVQGIPMLLLLRGGRLVDHRTGALPKRALDEWLDARLTAG